MVPCIREELATTEKKEEVDDSLLQSKAGFYF